VDSTPLLFQPPEAFLDELPRKLARVLARAPGEQLLSLSLYARDFPGIPGMPAAGSALWWGRAADARFRVGAGRCQEFEAHGQGRFRELAAAHAAMLSSWGTASLDDSPVLRAAFLGFAFSPDFDGPALPGALLCVPRVVAERRGAATLMHFNGAAAEDRDFLVTEWTRIARELVAAAWSGTLAPDAGAGKGGATAPRADDLEWASRVEHALAAIKWPILEKLVLTRRIELELGREASLDRVLPWLVARYPEAAVFAVRRQDTTLVGASPERLLGLDHGLVVADALAGSAPRAAAASADAKLGASLLGDPKELIEHAVVVRYILAALEPLCTGLVASHAPSLLRLPHVQHLASHVHGRTKPGVNVFDLLERMHPTPAVGGAPREAALAWLRNHGETDRGWYTGGVGWLDDAGGDIWVALRCATLQGRVASLYAGAGIVAGSNPTQELRETDWKLQAMLEALAVD
jgi:isochorismate synthase